MVLFFTLDEPENISFESNRTNNMATVGNSITITCKADAFPSPNYTILHNGENLKYVVNGVKTFKSVKRSDNGSYICTAKNVLGNASKDFILTVQGEICVKKSLCAMVSISCVYLFDIRLKFKQFLQGVYCVSEEVLFLFGIAACVFNFKIFYDRMLNSQYYIEQH